MEIRKGIVVAFRADLGTGTIRPDGGGCDASFRVDTAKVVVERGGSLAFGGFVTEPIAPAPGVRIVYIETPDGSGGMKALPWGLVDVPSTEGRNYATDPIGTLIERKSENGEIAGVHMALLDASGQMNELEFRVLCAITLDGEALWQAFNAWAKGQGRDVGFMDYVAAEFARNRAKIAGPRQCQHGDEIKRFVVREGLTGQAVSREDRVLLFLEDAATMARLAPGICHGCNMDRCANYAAFSRRGGEQRRR